MRITRRTRARLTQRERPRERDRSARFKAPVPPASATFCPPALTLPAIVGAGRSGDSAAPTEAGTLRNCDVSLKAHSVKNIDDNSMAPSVSMLTPLIRSLLNMDVLPIAAAAA
jgi:hypothetical protein